MLIKSPSILQVFTRQREVTEPRELSRKQWIMADRIVMASIMILVIAGAIFFA